jgi:myo-inositol-1(or 4)-monophosphatase
VDGSTNASRSVPWYSTSLCVLDAEGPLAALVYHQVTEVRYEAVRGGGARRDDAPIRPSGCRDLGQAIVAVSGLPHHNPGWAQLRMFGAASLDICSVGEGTVDAYTVGGGSTLYPWDYLGALLVCTEAGAVAIDGNGEDLVSREASHRSPVVAATAELLGTLAAADV